MDNPRIRSSAIDVLGRDNSKGILAICALNKLENKKEINKIWLIKRLKIRFNWRSKKNMWGRFGGGWNWCLGIQIGCTTLLINLLFFSLSFSIKSK